MAWTEQELLQLKFGYAIQKIINANKKIVRENKAQGKTENNPAYSYDSIYNESGISKGTMNEIVWGRANLTLSTIVDLAKCLHISIDELIKVLNGATEKRIIEHLKKLEANKKGRKNLTKSI